jgi:hypothetical protein
MKCEYDDGIKVDYSGSLRIEKGDDVNLYLKKGFIPGKIKGALQSAARHNDCVELRKAACLITDAIESAYQHE